MKKFKITRAKVKKIVYEDIKQYFVQSLTPDRAYECPPVDNVWALVQEIITHYEGTKK